MPKRIIHPTLYLWLSRTLYIGRLEKPFVFANHPPVFILGLEAPLDVRESIDSEPLFRARSVMVPAGTKVVISSEGAIGHACMDYLGRDADALAQSFHEAVPYQGSRLYTQHVNEQALSELIVRSALTWPDPKTLYEELEALLITQGAWLRADPRVEKAIDLVRGSFERYTVETLASYVNLSVPRFTQLVKQEAGVPLRRLKMWHMVFLATLLYSRGKDLSEAASCAGYTDYSHFSKSVFEMCGQRPSDVLSGRKQVKIHALLSQELAQHPLFRESRVITT